MKNMNWYAGAVMTLLFLHCPSLNFWLDFGDGFTKSIIIDFYRTISDELFSRAGELYPTC